MAHRVTRAKTSPPDPTLVEDIDNDPEHDKDETTEDEILEQFEARYKLCKEVWQDQRDREREDLEFQVPENQWPEEVRAGRKARPTLSVSLLAQPMNLIINQMRSADLGINIHPVSEKADKETAEARQGIYRAIERDGADTAREWAYSRAVQAGMGFYRVATEYDPDGGMPGDQKIVIRRILNQFSVYLDPAAQEPDFSDGDYAIIASWMPAGEFKRRWPKSKLKSNEGIVSRYYDQIPAWVRAKEGSKDPDILVGEYWYKVKEFQQFEVMGPDGPEEREREVAKVYRVMVGGSEMLEDPALFPGELIPIIPVIGQELQPFDESRIWHGMVRPAKDAQRAFNYAISSAVERAALEPRAPFLADKRAIEGFRNEWERSNVDNKAVLLFNGWDTAINQPIPKPERQQIDTQGTSLNLEIAQMSRDNVQAATAIFDPSLGKTTQVDRSGKQIDLLQRQADAGSSHFLQNFAKITLPYEARVVNGIMPIVYDREGRIVRIVTGEDKKDKPIMINRPFMEGQGNQLPQPAPMGQQGAKHYRISQDTYGVSVTVGKSYQTRQQEGAEMIGEVLGKQPALVPIIGDIFYRYQDFPGAREIADRLAKLRQQQFPGLGEDEEGGQPTPEMMKAEIMRGKQQMQMMGQQMQAMQHALETEQAKQQAQMAKAQLDAQVKMQELQMEMAKVGREDDTKRAIAAADNETKLLIANLANEVKVMLETLGMQREAMIADRQLENDERDRAHQAGMAEQAQAHDARKTAFGAGAKAGEAERGRQFQSREAESQRQADAESADRQREYDESQAQQTREHEAAMAAMKPAPGGEDA